MYQDPEMSEIVDEFTTETKSIASELEDILDRYEDQRRAVLLEQFGQIIDRVMGAAKSIEAEKIGYLAELGKVISYKAGQTNEEYLLDVTTGILFDLVEIMSKMNKKLEKEKSEDLSHINFEAFSTRLKWLSEKFSSIQRSSVEVDQSSIDDLLENLGI